MTSTGKKLSIISFSGDFDKAIAVFTLATGAAAVGREVNLFFTFWGLNIIRKKSWRSITGKGILDRVFNFLMGGLACLPLSRFNFLGLSPLLMTYMMKKNNVATLPQLIESANELGVRLFACEMAMNILGITRGDLVPEVQKVVGVVGFLEEAKDGEVLFI